MSKNAADREDFLEEDAEIPGQKFALLSFLSPEKVLKDKNLYFFEQFLKTYEFASRTKNMEAFLMKAAKGVNSKLEEEAARMEAADLSGAAAICRSAMLRVDTLMGEFVDFQKANERELRESKLKEAFDDFLYANKARLEDEFFQKNEFRTTVRGLKVRGVYGSQAEAVARSKKLQRLDTLHNIFVGEVGKWLPWDPEPNDVQDQEYAEDQLNTLMKKYKENEEARESFEREQRSRAIAGAKKAEKAGITVLPDTESTGESVPAIGEAPAGGPSFSDMFSSSGPADLAIARKMGGAAGGQS